NSRTAARPTRTFRVRIDFAEPARRSGRTAGCDHVGYRQSPRYDRLRDHSKVESATNHVAPDAFGVGELCSPFCRAQLSRAAEGVRPYANLASTSRLPNPHNNKG